MDTCTRWRTCARVTKVELTAELPLWWNQHRHQRKPVTRPATNHSFYCRLFILSQLIFIFISSLGAGASTFTFNVFHWFIMLPNFG